MDPTPPGDLQHASPRPPAPSLSTLAGAGSILHTLSNLAGPDQLDRVLLTLALHPDGVGFDRAKLMIWESRASRFHGRWASRGGRHGLSIREALERAGAANANGSEGETKLVGIQEGSPADLGGPAAIAWQRGVCAVATSDAAPGATSLGAQIGAVALKRGGQNYALVIGEWSEPGQGARREATLEAFAATAEWALAEYDRNQQAHLKARQAAATAEMVRATVSPGNLAEILHVAARLASQGSGARGGALWLAGTSNGPRLEVTHGPASQRERLGRLLQPLAATVMASGRARVADGPSDELPLPPDQAASINALVVLPLAAYGRNLGAIAVYDRIRPHPGDPVGFGQPEVDFLSSLADLTALAIDHAARFGELEQLEHKRRELTQRLRRQERLSSLGENAARVAQEVRNPIASIRTFARRARGALVESAPEREYLEIVLRETDRLERLLAEQMDHAVVEPPTMRLQSLNDVVQATLQRVGEILVRRRVRLLKKLSPEVPALLLDADRIGQMMARILENALETVSIGGRIRVETRKVGQHAVVEVAHDGPRGPGAALDHLFVPFATSRTGGPGIGLGLAQRIVREHGGEIRVRAEGEWSTVIAFTLPILDNQDRRRGNADRRTGRSDRRSRMPQG